MTTPLQILCATALVSLTALVGMLLLGMNQQLLRRTSFVLVAFASGALLGGAFFHLLPEAMSLTGEGALAMAALGILSFFALEKWLCWRHCHSATCDVHGFTYMTLLGDGIHNFVDGVLIAAAFLHSSQLGVVTTSVVIFHEVPQELGDFGVLIHGGFSKTRALQFNLLAGLTAIAGGAVGYVLTEQSARLQPHLLAFTAGGFLYTALADLVPEMHKHRGPGHSIAQFALLSAGLAFLWVGRLLTHG
jgi:zinc and cadmium transporter